MRYLQIARRFLLEVWGELKKVTWLSRKEVIASTSVVVLLVGVLSLFIGTVDFILAKFLGVLLR